HRVGRTARMGKEGAAVSFVTQDDGPYLTAIEKLINKEIQQDSFPGFELQREDAPKPEAKKKKAERPPGVPPWANVKRRRR
nr:DEAD/DEAH box helicase [Planctomycetota bacterium]